MENTSLKQVLQGMIPDNMGIYEGDVISIDPLKIKVVNNDKLIIDEAITIIPKHLKDYKVNISIYNARGGELNANTDTACTECSHAHKLNDFSLTEAKAIIHNGLKLDDRVTLLSYNKGKQWYILDRKGG